MKYLLLVLLLVCFSSCDLIVEKEKELVTEYNYRSISEQELLKFTPFGYEVIENDFGHKVKPIEIENENGNNDFLVFLCPELFNEFKPEYCNLILLRFDNKKDEYFLLDRYEIKGQNVFSIEKPFIGFGDKKQEKGQIRFAKGEIKNVNDINDNNYKEFEFMTQRDLIAGQFYIKYILEVVNNKIIEFTNSELFIGPNTPFSYIIEEKDNEGNIFYFVLNEFWNTSNENEGRFGCHQYDIRKVVFDGEKYKTQDSFKTNNKYCIDSGLVSLEDIKCTIGSSDEIKEKILLEYFKAKEHNE